MEHPDYAGDAGLDGDLGDPRGQPALRTRATAFRERWRERHRRELPAPLLLRWTAVVGALVRSRPGES